MGRPGKDWTNQKFNMLTFIKPTGRKIYKDSLEWEARCDCGNLYYARATDIARGVIKSCGCHRPYSSKEVGLRTRRFEPHISSARAVWRGIYRDCEFKLFLSLSQLPCHYCNRLPHRTFNIASTLNGPKINYKVSDFQKNNGDFTYNGLDRVDSNKGHTIDNVVPCCRNCNTMKSDMTYEEFMAHIKLIYKHTNSPTFMAYKKEVA